MTWAAMRWNILKSNYHFTTLKNFVRDFREYRSYSFMSCIFRYNKLCNSAHKYTTELEIMKVNNRLLSLSSILRRTGHEKRKADKPQKVDLTEARQFLNVDRITAQMDKAIEELKDNYVQHLSVRSSVGSMDQIIVTYEGEEYILQELVQIVYKPKLVVLNAISFPQAIPQILDAIAKSGMNVNPQQDGTTIFVPIPKVTKEHRENLAKNAKAIFIRTRDKIKDIRNKECRSLQNKPSISKDQIKRIHAQLDIICDNYVKIGESILDSKQKELMKVTD